MPTARRMAMKPTRTAAAAARSATQPRTVVSAAIAPAASAPAAPASHRRVPTASITGTKATLIVAEAAHHVQMARHAQ